MAGARGRWLGGHRLLMLNVLFGLMIIFSGIINIPPVIKQHLGTPLEAGEEDILPAQRIISIINIMFVATAALQTFYSLTVLHASRDAISNPQFGEKAFMLFTAVWIALDAFGIFQYTRWRADYGDICQFASSSKPPVNGCLNQDSFAVMLITAMLNLMLAIYLAIYFHKISFLAAADDVEAANDSCSSNRHSCSSIASRGINNRDSSALEVFVAQYSELINKPFAIDGVWYRYQAVKMAEEDVPSAFSERAVAQQPPPYIARPGSPTPGLMRSGTMVLGALTGTPTTHSATNSMSSADARPQTHQ